MSHSGCALVWHVQPRVVIFPCRTHYRPSSVKWRPEVEHVTRWRSPSVTCSTEGNIHVFPCRTNFRVSYVLSSDQLQESWIICKLKSFSPMYLHDLNIQDTRVIFGVFKTLCDFGHKNLLQKNKLINYRHHSNLFVTCPVYPVVDRIKRYA